MLARSRATAMALIALALAACSSPGPTTVPPGTDGGRTPGVDAGPLPPGTDAAIPPGTDAALPPGVDGGPATGGGIPCDVLADVRAGCMTCHAATPMFGAPMPLATRDDFFAAAATMPARLVHEVAHDRVSAGTMPPSGQPFTTEQRDRLLAWLDAGLPARAAGVMCDPGPGPGPGIGPEHLPCTPTHTFVAHGASASEPYAVPVEGDSNTHTCFAFRNPLSGGAQATAWAPVIDDTAVMHHWILWGTDGEPPGGGDAPFPCETLPTSDSVFVMGWAPGGRNAVMPDDVGVALTSRWLILQNHYFVTEAGHDDASGVAVCTTTTPRPNVAGVLAFGTTSIDIPARARGATAVGTCPATVFNLLGSDVHVLSSGPHMHTFGTAFRSEIIRSGGGTEIMADIPMWSFNDQAGVPHSPPLTIRRGDSVRVTCTYDNPTSSTIGFGENTTDEMCFDFALVWPIDRWPSGVPRFCTF